MTKPDILRALGALIASPPGIKAADYDDAKAYRADLYKVRQQRRDAEQLLFDVAVNDAITTSDLMRALTGGRIVLGINGTAHYNEGQYYPTEYRAAVARLLAGVVWAATIATRPADGTGGDTARALLRKRYGKRLTETYF